MGEVGILPDCLVLYLRGVDLSCVATSQRVQGAILVPLYHFMLGKCVIVCFSSANKCRNQPKYGGYLRFWYKVFKTSLV